MKFARYSLLSVIFVCALVFNSCKNDLVLNAPYKEVPSIYAVLNPQDRINIIRVNKVFLGEGDANEMAKVADSINYQPGELAVSLKYSGGGADIVFRDSLIKASEGAFNTTQRVYVTSEKLMSSGTYTLNVKNTKTGNLFTAKAASIDSISGNQLGAPLKTPYYPYAPGTPPGEYIDYSSLNQSYSINYAFKDGAVYQVVMRLHFTELFNGGTYYKWVDYTFGNQYPKDAIKTGGYIRLVVEFKGRDVFSAVGVGLSKMGLSDLATSRKMYKIEYLVYSSTQDYIDYLQFAAPSFGISQSKPLYSNFDNRSALGIFTFRSRCSVMKEVANPFISEFSSNPNTCSYKFLNSGNQMAGCP